VEKTVLIVTDGTESTGKTAEAIASHLVNHKVISVKGADFQGTHLLSASICFFGAENPNPPSFSYLHKVLAHINLAGRPCGIFSGSQKTADYLCAMVHDSELALYSDSFLGNGDIKAWTEKVLAAHSAQ
jgi:hypothetical protein